MALQPADLALRLNKNRSLVKKLSRFQTCASLGVTVGIIVGATGLYEITKNPVINGSITPDIGHKLLFAGVVIVMAAFLAEMAIRSAVTSVKETTDFLEAKATEDTNAKVAFWTRRLARLGSFTAMVIAADFAAEAFKGVMLHGNSTSQAASGSGLHTAAISVLIAIGLGLLAMKADNYILMETERARSRQAQRPFVDTVRFFGSAARGSVFAIAGVGVAASAVLAGAITLAGACMITPLLGFMINIAYDASKANADNSVTNLQLGGNGAVFVGAIGAVLTTMLISDTGTPNIACLHANVFEMIALMAFAIVMAIGVITAAVGKEQRNQQGNYVELVAIDDRSVAEEPQARVS